MGKTKCFGSLGWILKATLESSVVSTICVEPRFACSEGSIWDNFHADISLHAARLTRGVEAHAVIQLEARAAAILASRSSDGSEMEQLDVPGLLGVRSGGYECVPAYQKVEVIQVHTCMHTMTLKTHQVFWSW